MRKLMLCISVVAGLASCSDSKAPLSNDERSLIAELGFDEPLMTKVRENGRSIERLVGVTPDFDPAPADALVVSVDPGQGRAALKEIRTALAGTDYSAYLNDQAYGYGADKIAILKSHDDYEYLAIVRTDGINFDLEHEDVLARYRQWDQSFGLSLIGAGQDWLEAEFGTPPGDWSAFAQEVYEFCPDIVDQGTGDVKTLAEEMRTSNTLYLWWD